MTNRQGGLEPSPHSRIPARQDTATRRLVETAIDRRHFHKLALASFASAIGLPACDRPGDYSAADVESLERQRRLEATAAGQGPFGKLSFRGYRGLADLPYFELNEHGRLRLAVDGVSDAFDFHAHLGMNFLFAPDIDLLRRTPRTQYFLDCDRDTPGCDFDLDTYINSAFTEQMHSDMEREVRNQVLFGSDAAATHTIPNLLDEMDAMGFRRAAVLAIAAGLPFGDNVTQRWLDAVASAHASDRLIVFASVHPSDGGWRKRLRGYARRGARGVKIHPEMQRVFPDEPRLMDIYAECERLGLVVIFHAGRSGIEPQFMRKYALMRRYIGAVESFPRVQFAMGHAGARDVADALDLARKYPNVWLEITGQGVTKLDAIIAEFSHERLLFGSDWPFYPLAATLAKVLLVTEKRPEARAAILRDNADRIFAAAASTRAAHSAGA